MAFDYLKSSAELSFADAERLHERKPDTAMAARADGHEALAIYYFATGAGDGFIELRIATEIEVARYRSFGKSLRPLMQYRYLIFALAIRDVGLAREIGNFPVDRKNWSKFDSATTQRICEILGIPQETQRPDASFTPAEQVFLRALDQVASGQSYDVAEVQGFWRALRKKRYGQTVFEHKELFTPALDTLRAV